MAAFQALLRKEFAIIWGSGNILASTFGFALLLIVVASFSFRQIGYGEAELRSVTPGILLMVFLFSGLLGLSHSFLQEREDQALQGVILTGVGGTSLYFSKALGNLLFIGGVHLVALASHALLFGANLGPELLLLAIVTLLFTLGFVGLGTLLAGISVVVKEREILLPMVLFPLVIPLVAGCIELARAVLATGALPWESFWFLLVVVFDTIALTLSWALFDVVVRP